MQQPRQHIHRRLIVALLALSVSGSVVFADPYEDGFAAYNRGDYATALQIWRPLAEQGNALAQTALGVMYYNGKGVAKDFNEAVKWYRLAAAQGNVSAQVDLSSMYYEGEGVAEDFIRAHMWLSIAATQGNADVARMRDIVSNGMTAQQLVESKAMAAKCELSSYKQCD